MKARILFGAIGCTLIAWNVGAAEQSPAIRYASVADEQADLERRWRWLEMLIGTQTAGAPLNSSRDHYIWKEYTRRLIWDEGMSLFHTYPQDKRRWGWVRFAARGGANYIDVDWVIAHNAQPGASNEQNREASRRWEQERIQLRKLALADPDIPSDVQAELLCMDLRERIPHPAYKAIGGARPEDTDFSQLGKDVITMAGQHPGYTANILRALLHRLLTSLKVFAPQQLPVTMAMLRESPNPVAREFGIADETIKAAMTSPIDLRFTAMDGREIDMAKLRGKVVLLVFGGITWCPSCRAEEPYLQAAYDKYRKRGFEILSILYEKEEARTFVSQYVKERGLSWPHYFDGLGEQNPLVKRFAVTAVPAHFLFDKRGLLVSRDARGSGLDVLVERYLDLQHRHSTL
jgi:thiol-disulfide isomerase/thioredoxin